MAEPASSHGPRALRGRDLVDQLGAIPPVAHGLGDAEEASSAPLSLRFDAPAREPGHEATAGARHAADGPLERDPAPGSSGPPALRPVELARVLARLRA